MCESTNCANMKFLILIALLSPVASRLNGTAEYTYKATNNCGGHNSILSVKNCPDNDFCVYPSHKSIDGSLVIKFGEEIKEPLFFTYSAAEYRLHGDLYKEIHSINGSVFLCDLIECPLKPHVEYRLPFQLRMWPAPYPYFADFQGAKMLFRVTAVVDNLEGDVEVCAKRDIIQAE